MTCGIDVRTYVEQVRDGLEYLGHVDFEGSLRFNYRVRFGMPLRELFHLAESDGVCEDVYRHIQLDVTDPRGEKVELGNLWDPGPLDRAFYQACVIPSMEMFCNPQVRDAHDGWIFGSSRRDIWFNLPGVTETFSTRMSQTFVRTPELERSLDSYR